MKIQRLHYRAKLKNDYDKEAFKSELVKCQEMIRSAQKSGQVLTAALYFADTADISETLFFYYEGVGEDNVASPEELLEPINAFLWEWPGTTESRIWVKMYHIYYHSVPESVKGWKRAAKPELRRGRIALLYEEKLFSYVYYHKAIVDEGLLKGDKYQSIALHENVLFSYFEEPKTMVNIKNSAKESEVIEEWLAVDPESHFIHTPECEGLNFMFLPTLFALGVEDLED
ncbi:MAG: hypothetical protein IJ324_00980 [Lachnospiraceae bacterium]|nr:hypothetical protein [Lachnospiraceae bacterium]